MEDAKQKKIGELRQKFPGKRIARVRTQGKDYYLGAPTREQWHGFLDAIAEPKRARVAMENLAKKCALEPSAEQLDAMFGDRPGLAAKLAEAVGELAGVDDKAEIEVFGES